MAPLKTYGLVEAFRGESDTVARDLITQGKFGEAIEYCNKNLEKYPDSAYYVWDKGTAFVSLKMADEALTCFASVLEKFDRYSKSYSPTAKDLIDVTYSSLWVYTAILVALGKKNEADKSMDDFFKSMRLLEPWCYERNKDYGERILCPDMAEYGAYAHALRNEPEEALALVQRLVDYWQAYFNHFGEPCNVNRLELVEQLRIKFNQEAAFEDLAKDDRLWVIVDGLKRQSK